MDTALHTDGDLGETAVKAYVAGLAASAVAIAAAWTYWFGAAVEGRFVLGTVVFGVLLVLIGAFPLRISERCEFSALDLGLVAAMVVLGPSWAAVSALPCAVLAGKKDPLRVAYEASRYTVQIYVAGMLFFVASGPLLTENQGPASATVYAALASAAALLVVNYIIHAGLLKVKYRQELRKTWEEDVEPFLASDAVNVITVGLGVLAMLAYGPVAALIVVAGSVGSQILAYRSRIRGTRAGNCRSGSDLWRSRWPSPTPRLEG